MAAPLKKQIQEQEEIVHEKPKYHTFELSELNESRIQDLLFFVRLSSFSILTVLSCFVLLVHGTSPYLAIPLGMFLGALLTVTLTFLLDLLKR